MLGQQMRCLIAILVAQLLSGAVMANDSRIEGWHDDSYLIIFSQSEKQDLAIAYGLNTRLPGYNLVGLEGWDNFIVSNSEGENFIVSTIPALPKDLKHYNLNIESPKLTPDERFAGKIKWYVKSIIFGGDPQIGGNVIWIPIEKHTELVKWWNQKVAV